MNSGDITPLRVITVFSGSADSLDERYIQVAPAWLYAVSHSFMGLAKLA